MTGKAPLFPAASSIRDDEVFLRMTFPERLQHFTLIASMVVLILTGLPLILVESKVFKTLFALEKAFAVRGVLHRIAAVVLILNIAGHILSTIFTARGRANFKALLPKWQDARDAGQAFGYNLGWTKWLHRKGVLRRFFDKNPYWKFERPPSYDRYNFIEKFEYWAVAWGSFIMIFSGFFMWKVELSLRLFPLWVHDIFILVHGYEAILAFLAVIIWHMYNVHLNPEVFPMSRIWLNGKITGHELRALHPLEYARIAAERKRSTRDIPGV
jgi:cytochrome b subunit of formate dehydrogenase